MGRGFIRHFRSLEEYTKAFQPELSGKERLPEPIDPTKPIATEDLAELKSFLALADHVTQYEIDQVLKLLENKGTNYDYFFANATNPVWLPHLSEQGYFLNPPIAEHTIEGDYVVPGWPPLKYLKNIYGDEQDKVLDVLSNVPKTSNFRVLHGMLEIIVKSDSVQPVARFSHVINSFIDNYVWGYDLLVKLLNKPFMFDSKLSEFTPSLLFKLAEFKKDPRYEEKRSLHKKDQNAYGATLKPRPRFDDWEYREILEKGFRPLAKIEPYQVARILIDAVSGMIRLGKHQIDFDKGEDEDYSEIWWPRLGKADSSHQDSKEVLVNTLTYACEQVYCKASESIDALDQALRNTQWKVFKRLRQQLYALYPSDVSLPWIREFIVEHADYSEWEHHYEFQIMVRNAAEHYGKRLLTEDELSYVVDTILQGPSQDNYRKWMGEGYSDEAYYQRKRFFHFMQLLPFEALLSEEYLRYFNELKNDFADKEISDDSYSPVSEVRVGHISRKSPISFDELGELSDEELLAYINEWNDEHRDKDDWLIEIDISSLADVFQSLFKEKIIPDDERLAYWMNHSDKIARPIYVTSMVKAMKDEVTNNQLDKMSHWIEYCSWVLTHQDVEQIEGQPEPRHNSRTHPDWRLSRKAVVNFITVCVSKDSDVSITARKGLAALLQQAVSQYDRVLDHDHSSFLERVDPITTAINSTRSMAIECLVQFGLWIRRHLPDDPVPDVIDILCKRITGDVGVSLTGPEYAILGMLYGNLCFLNRDWSSDQKRVLFPKDNISDWRNAFGSYILYNNPHKDMFDILEDDFDFALKNISTLSLGGTTGRDVVVRLARHIFSYYIWGVFSLKGEDSLLSSFYEETDNSREHWTYLFEYVGHSFSNSDSNIDRVLVSRAKDYFNWRYEVAEIQEIQEFTYWLKADCFDVVWRLQSYSKILDIGPGDKKYYKIELEILNEMLNDQLPLVVECFEKITRLLNQGNKIYIPDAEAKPIIIAGLESDDPQIVENAEHARENLLRNGYLKFVDLE